MYIYICVYIYILGSSAHFSRAMAYGIVVRDYITELNDGVILRDLITELYVGMILRNYITQS